ncbi:MAG: ribonuclease H-like domain-containing protein [Minisyncoccia bacterium]
MMSNDTIVFDIETQNFFTDEGVGWNNFEALKISVLALYSYNEDRYFCFEEKELNQAYNYFLNSKYLVGFSINRYDIPVLNIYFQKLNINSPINLWGKERIDLLEEVEKLYGERISLSKLSEANLGEKKERHGSEAGELFFSGQIEELKKYCLKDVELTKRLYDLYSNQNKLIFPDKKTGQNFILDFKNKKVIKPGLF